MKGRSVGKRGARRFKAALAVFALALVAIPALALGALGEFSEPATAPEPVQDTNNSVVAGDFNNDGKFDLVVTTAETGKRGLMVLLGDGAGDFSAAPTSPETVTGGPWEALAGKFNADANLDLAVSSETDITGEDGKVTVLIGDGTGNFAPAAGPTSFTSASREISAADLDEDGDLDLAVGELYPAKVSVLLNNGSGVMSKAAGSPEEAGAAATNVSAIATADLNEDEAVDIVAGNNFSKEIRVFLNDGDEDGDFTPASPIEGVAKANDLAFGFFDDDALPDLAIANAEHPEPADNSVEIRYGNGSGGFTGAASLGLAKFPSTVVAADFNGDEVDDIATTGGPGPGFYAVFLNDGEGGFTPAGGSPKPIGSYPSDIAVGHLNSDGSNDLAITNIFGKSLNILLNDFAPTEPPKEEPPAGNPPGNEVPKFKTPVKKCPKGKKLKKGKCVKKKCKKGKKLKKGKCVKKKAKARRRS